MSENYKYLFEIADGIKGTIEDFNSNDFEKIFEDVKESITKFENSFCGSWLGYHSRVYYKDFQSPPAGARFSQEWGLMDEPFNNGTTGDWAEYKYDDVIDAILNLAGNPDLETVQKETTKLKEVFEDKREEFLSIASQYLQVNKDPFIEKQKNKAEELKVFDQSDFIEYLQPKGKFITRDSAAVGQQVIAPPHIAVKCNVLGLQSPHKCLKDLEKYSRRASSHLAKKERENKREEEIGTNVFIGHGHSLVWKDLKDFIQDRLNLPWDEFNRVPAAGITNISRLSEMLNDVAFAFIIMTAEDEKANGKMMARMNVIHEVGLFQGRLGFTKAIILLEEGCKEFSNIEGLGQIRFPKDNIKAAFEEIRQVLEREDLL